jgi:hypothetical protein
VSSDPRVRKALKGTTHDFAAEVPVLHLVDGWSRGLELVETRDYTTTPRSDLSGNRRMASARKRGPLYTIGGVRWRSLQNT